MYLKRVWAVFLLALVAGCGDDGDDAPVTAVPDPSLPGVYTGVFPCGNCPGIETTLWLRADGRFFFEQQYLPDDTGDAMHAHNMGRWEWVPAERDIVLAGAGPSRSFTHPDRDTLLMRTGSDLEHRLSRNPAAPDFNATVRMTGVMTVRGDSVSFSECLTGFVVPVSKGGDFGKFWHQYRSAATQREATFVGLDGRFAWSDTGIPASMTIDGFVTIKDQSGC